jgi:hypothetical protein
MSLYPTVDIGVIVLLYVRVPAVVLLFINCALAPPDAPVYPVEEFVVTFCQSVLDPVHPVGNAVPVPKFCEYSATWPYIKLVHPATSKKRVVISNERNISKEVFMVALVISKSKVYK